MADPTANLPSMNVPALAASAGATDAPAFNVSGSDILNAFKRVGSFLSQPVSAAAAAPAPAAAPAAPAAPVQAASTIPTPNATTTVTAPANVTPAPTFSGGTYSGQPIVASMGLTPAGQHAQAVADAAAAGNPAAYARSTAAPVAAAGVGGGQPGSLESALGSVPLFMLPGVVDSLAKAKGTNDNPEGVLTQVAMSRYMENHSKIDQALAAGQLNVEQAAAQRAQANAILENNLRKNLISKTLPQTTE